MKLGMEAKLLSSNLLKIGDLSIFRTGKIVM